MSELNRPAPAPGNGWDPNHPEDLNRWKGWLSEHSHAFDKGVTKLKEELKKAFDELAGDGSDDNTGDPTDPKKLAKYQTALSEYTTYRSLQSNSAKSLADMQKQNARNLG
ncbi:EscF/YscF/HrpA family type III secretion system needle major subunit [Stenotrophomonas sp. 278]|uniref:EscF/YscF/HrpA family type III secretion system needle major subunit n=1 Tax=Stenotrophomonas sp. 278 TaxID=2479851 RepID=UPI000F67E219|nr:EscF/YscF/HrpA family type III secretion system needle major subunit [Stenotrophomonas sp. 278]RRU21166.1 hypothetical protein EGJ34_04450 [Stenotrophomonas sp. 278]